MQIEVLAKRKVPPDYEILSEDYVLNARPNDFDEDVK